MRINVDVRCPNCGGKAIALCCYAPPTIQFACMNQTCNHAFSQVGANFPLRLLPEEEAAVEAEKLKEELKKLKEEIGKLRLQVENR